MTAIRVRMSDNEGKGWSVDISIGGKVIESIPATGLEHAQAIYTDVMSDFERVARSAADRRLGTEEMGPAVDNG